MILEAALSERSQVLGLDKIKVESLQPAGSFFNVDGEELDENEEVQEVQQEVAETRPAGKASSGMATVGAAATCEDTPPGKSEVGVKRLSSSASLGGTPSSGQSKASPPSAGRGKFLLDGGLLLAVEGAQDIDYNMDDSVDEQTEVGTQVSYGAGVEQQCQHWIRKMCLGSIHKGLRLGHAIRQGKDLLEKLKAGGHSEQPHAGEVTTLQQHVRLADIARELAPGKIHRSA
jgi:hypothetical protein